MSPRRTRKNPFARIRKKLRDLQVFNFVLFDCAQCGKRVATIRETVRREEADGAALCQSCFEMILRNAAQAPEYQQVEHDSLSLDGHPSELRFPEGWTRRGRGD